MLMGTGDSVTGSVLPDNNLQFGNTDGISEYTINCITFRPRTSGFDTEWSRSAQETQFVGFANRGHINITGDSSWIHRRIIFEFSRRIGDAILPGNSTNGLMWNSNRYAFPLSSGDATWHDLVFTGKLGVDWASPVDAPVDKKRVKIWQDRTRIFNMNGDTLRCARFYGGLFPRKRAVYSEDESGYDVDAPEPMDGVTQGQSSSGWLVESSDGMHNLYVLDIVDEIRAQNAERGAFNLRLNTKVYWHER